MKRDSWRCQAYCPLAALAIIVGTLGPTVTAFAQIAQTQTIPYCGELKELNNYAMSQRRFAPIVGQPRNGNYRETKLSLSKSHVWCPPFRVFRAQHHANHPMTPQRVDTKLGLTGHSHNRPFVLGTSPRIRGSFWHAKSIAFPNALNSFIRMRLMEIALP